MDLLFEWQEPILLAKRRKIVVDDSDIELVEPWPGVYFFARRFSSNFTPFYIGESINLRQRLKNHLATRRIADVLRGIEIPEAPVISQGARTFHYAYFIARRGHTAPRCLDIAQKFMIQEAVSKGVPLLNLQLMTIKAHRISFDGRVAARGMFKKTNYLPEDRPQRR
jgi:hypothetical protein